MNYVSGVGGMIVGLLAIATLVGWVRRSPWPGTATGAALGVLVLLSTPVWLLSRRWCVADGSDKAWIVAACIAAAGTPLLAGAAWDRARYDGESPLLAAAGYTLAGAAFVAVAFRFGVPDRSVCVS
jgi:hypothetical protein